MRDPLRLFLSELFSQKEGGYIFIPFDFGKKSCIWDYKLSKVEQNIHVSDDVEELINLSAVLEFSAKLLNKKEVYIPKSCQH